jgi:hypothetical protein
MRRPPPPHAQIHLPPLDTSSALTVVDVLERAIAAIWRAHGDAMADLQAARGIETPRPVDAVWASDPDGAHDDCF